ncbi:MAG: hypothetical protein AAF821_14385 [Cyanobacteria bacterium P01_D01_bin.156]
MMSPLPSLEPASKPPGSTQVPLELPQGFTTETEAYRQGHMRLATGADELAAHHGSQMMDSDAYGILLRLSRVTQLQGHPQLSADDVGHLFMADVHYLIELYNDINPSDYRLSLMGELLAIPWNSCTKR